MTDDSCLDHAQVLGALLVCPGRGALLGRLAWALGRGIGGYLLQQAQWVLQARPAPLDTPSMHETGLSTVTSTCIPGTDPAWPGMQQCCSGLSFHATLSL